MKVSLANKKTDCRAYGLDFNSKGICNADKKVVESLVNSGALIVEQDEAPKIARPKAAE